MRSGTYNVTPASLIADPDHYNGHIIIFGGIIVDTKITPDGSLVEAVFVPVDVFGSLKDTEAIHGRFLALYPKNKGLLDPLIFIKERAITVAAEFKGVRKGMIDKMEYTYPFFEIKDIYLWDESVEYYYIPPPVYPLWDYPFMYYDPWWRYYYY